MRLLRGMIRKTFHLIGFIVGFSIMAFWRRYIRVRVYIHDRKNTRRYRRRKKLLKNVLLAIGVKVVVSAIISIIFRRK